VVGSGDSKLLRCGKLGEGWCLEEISMSDTPRTDAVDWANAAKKPEEQATAFFNLARELEHDLNKSKALVDALLAVRVIDRQTEVLARATKDIGAGCAHPWPGPGEEPRYFWCVCGIRVTRDGIKGACVNYC
jgi:hypothetical protein